MCVMPILFQKNAVKSYSSLLFLGSLFGYLVFLSSLRIDFISQGYLSIVLLMLLMLIRLIKSQDFGRVLFITLSSYIVLRYFLWRVNYSLSYQDFFSFIGAVTLFAAELYGGLMFFLSSFVNIRQIERKPVPLPKNKALWPTVDVVIPSYDEPVGLVKITLAAARNIDYPIDKLKIYLLDDGGTEQKLNADDADKRASARLRKSRFHSLCLELGVNYLSREKNINAKAGNLNAALKHLSGELILVLDADHAPAVDILKKTVGSFVQDDQVFLVQTPHFFINPDPIEKNLNLFQRMPSENVMFYHAIQMGLDFWQSSFFCGSAAVLRRAAIDQVGGFSGSTITEDSETALKLHSQGWKSHYLVYPLISGLQPETFTSFMVQRTRWAQGMVQNFILHNPLWLPNLKVSQRFCYASNMMFWFFPFARFIFLVSPGLYLFFGLKIYNANIYEFFSYTVPYLAALLLTNHYLFSQVRWVFVSEIYETMQSLFSLKAVMAVLKNPHHPSFSVTPKVETTEHDFISPMVVPFYWTLFFTVLAAGFGIGRFMLYPDERSLIGITLVWALFNLLLLLAALGALYEQKQRRTNPRIPVHIDAHWLVKSASESGKQRVPVAIRDVSMGGGSLVSDHPLPVHEISGQTFLEVPPIGSRTGSCYEAVITNTSKRGEQYIHGIKFKYSTTEEYLNIVRFIHGDSSRWLKIQRDATNHPGLLKSMVFMINIGIYSGISHIKVALLSILKNNKKLCL